MCASAGRRQTAEEATSNLHLIATLKRPMPILIVQLLVCLLLTGEVLAEMQPELQINLAEVREKLEQEEAEPM